MANSSAIDREAIEATYAIIRPHVRRTPVVEVASDRFRSRRFTLVFKLELLQHSGSFKARGAFANLLLREVPPRGVVAASGGNHGAAVAYAAHAARRQGPIFVPTISLAGEDRAHPRLRRRARGRPASATPTRSPPARRGPREPARCRPCLRPGRDAARPGHARAGARRAGAGRSTRCWSPSAAAD